ncbi:glycosyltransferase involved in cell wall biosynthesis [Hephaestia caeni]|uniref:Glycosyltransferase involved in cell wall biosynthesis n=1 Tax=Hephaestia caeni TaxID=645617 RepID=A0A397P9N1_9SPHN|nr:glycosyltransferase family 1 protein [Hephaestia caeni]RIA46296.1 glycosyltransferase involved in cell wall biosynthesis [Hephaestia caeni]
MKLFDQTLPAGGGSHPHLLRTARVQPELVLDISRLLARLLHPTPTGVDRVEMAYARGLLARAPERLNFAAVHPSGLYGRLRHAEVRAFLDHTSNRWETIGVYESRTERHRQATRWFWRLRPHAIPPASRPRILIQPSPNHLDRPERMAAKVTRERAKLICLVHDLIPITHPEFARPGGAVRHRERIRTIEMQAHGVLLNSQATLNALSQTCGSVLNGRPMRVAPLGVEQRQNPSAVQQAGRPYFLCLGTIEPRKNHLLLLNVWRSIVERLGRERSPLLLIVGRRGWENENVIDMLDRCEMLRGAVRELDRIPDGELRNLISGARALLMPSFAEGFGLPVAEALAAQVPVIASDLPAHREAGGDVPDYLDPLDGAAWREAILAYTSDISPRRAAQISRLSGWSPTTWEHHVEAVLELAEEVAQC